MLKIFNSTEFSHQRETYQFCGNGTLKCTRVSINNYYAIILECYHGNQIGNQFETLGQ
jgi:hypothetical protein